jgi:hypothetical protein
LNTIRIAQTILFKNLGIAKRQHRKARSKVNILTVGSCWLVGL